MRICSNRLHFVSAVPQTEIVHSRELHAGIRGQLHPGNLHAAQIHERHLQRQRGEQIRLLEPPVPVDGAAVADAQ